MNDRNLNILEEIFNKNCKHCSSSERNSNLENGLCKLIRSVKDGLPVRCVGEWAVEKIYYLSRYFNLFSVGMHKKWKGNINYIEICCGPGRCISCESGNEFNGTCLSILKSNGFRYINKVFFADIDVNALAVLNSRIQNLNPANYPLVLNGDYNNPESFDSLIVKIPQNSLNLLFLDPTDLSLPFTTIEYLFNNIKNLDIIVNAAYFTDLKRNQKRIIRGEVSKEKYEQFLGTENFFNNDQVISYAEKDNDKELSRLFLDTYIKNFKKHGFTYSDINRVENKYILLFFSRHERGLKFWKTAKGIEYSGQRRLI
ncbi:MAG: three-Cys-motif partner protein TcmP [bacterium]|nr:three-Cys-motif partner protein TcmP [bacterium]